MQLDPTAICKKKQLLAYITLRLIIIDLVVLLFRGQNEIFFEKGSCWLQNLII
jgi:hypothetical protein